MCKGPTLLKPGLLEYSEFILHFEVLVRDINEGISAMRICL